MSRKLNLKQASEVTGLSYWYLRKAVLEGKIPYIRASEGKKGKIILDHDLLESFIEKLMMENVSIKED
jgi:predicted site-specific integrase-resolvase